MSAGTIGAIAGATVGAVALVAGAAYYLLSKPSAAEVPAEGYDYDFEAAENGQERNEERISTDGSSAWGR